MIIKIERKILFRTATIGDLFINGKFQCHTLEDQVRVPFVKVPGETAIPARVYDVVISDSKRFGVPMIEVLRVPEFSGIRIHAGNTDKDTEGCILVGMTVQGDELRGTALAYGLVLMQVYHAWMGHERITLSIG